ncbi:TRANSCRIPTION FACTOR WD40-LIKE FAMILY-RELATED [Salix purpurea]|uniref:TRANSCRIPTION FACTOR WD40-LIKE FAMILY-RELATED n=1 Tax=Salix purpurea TaxID=77065 RepID=A0A9Q0Q5H6_SALPP|nr:TRANSCRIPTION FACTOR WD40-LIKE FAMILY-RELATED [Salix purpurea]
MISFSLIFVGSAVNWSPIMSQYQGDEMDHVVDDYEIAEVDDDVYFHGRFMADSESEDDDDDEYDHLDNKITDTSATDARKGKDIQGIPWERLSISREKYRQTRIEQYKNYENVPQSGESSEKECELTKKGGKYYEFWRNTRSVKSTILHFQLRNLVWSTSKHDVYLMSHFSIVHWSSLSCKKNEVLNVSGHVAPCEKHPGSLLEGFTQTQVSTLAVKDRLLIAGGFQGELICKYLDRPGVSFCSRTTYDDNAITNAIEIYECSSGAVHFMASNNDSGVRDFDMERFQQTKHFCFDWPVNILQVVLTPDCPSTFPHLHQFPKTSSKRDLRFGKFPLCFGSTSLMEEGLWGKGRVIQRLKEKEVFLDLDGVKKKTALIHGNNVYKEVMLLIWACDIHLSAQCLPIMSLCGHVDFSFASAWHPDGRVFATGNQDKTCRIWDARNLSKSVSVLKGNLGAIRSIRFTSDGQFMSMAEPADFVHIYDAKNGFEKEQEIDFFGEISGVSFSPDTEALFIGVWDRTYGSLLQYNRRRSYSYLDSHM